MLRNPSFIVLGTGLGLALSLQAGCLPKPKQNYTNDQIGQLTSLEEVMRVQAETMDPLFGKRSNKTFTDEEFAQIAGGGRRLQATSATLRDKLTANQKPSFVTYAGQLANQANDLVAAAEAKDAAKAAATLGSIKETCSGCHKENR